MTLLVLGLAIFLGAHSTRIFAEGWRTGRIRSLGERPWKAVYSVISLIGFVLIVYGYGEARANALVLWNPPLWTRHVAALLTIPAFILLVAAYVPGNRIKARVGHPMVAGVKVWAFAHLLANGTLPDVLLFGGFLAWAVPCYLAARKRDRAAGRAYPVAGAGKDIVVVVVGLVAWAAFAFWLHGPLIGVRPFG
jgi:uncharacterized membrane protein